MKKKEVMLVKGGGGLKQISRVKTITKYLASQGLLQPGSGVLFSLPVSKPHELGHWDKTLDTWD